MTLHDTKSQSYKTSINQVFRDMHGFIIVCDITNLQSVRDVPDWLQQIEHKADVVQGRQVTVLVNKIETLIQDSSQSQVSGVMCRMSDNTSQSRLDM